MNTKDKGNIGEAVVLAEAITRGYAVLQPFGDNTSYDLVFDDGKTLSKVQVKAVTPYNGKIIIPCYSNTYSAGSGKGCKRHLYSASDTDIIIGMDLQTFCLYKFSIDEILKLSTKNGELTLRIDPPKNNQTKGVKWAKDYKW